MALNIKNITSGTSGSEYEQLFCLALSLLFTKKYGHMNNKQQKYDILQKDKNMCYFGFLEVYKT